MKGPSLRDLARSLGLSHTTVSEALRNCPRVHPTTRERVVKAALEAGYHYNPLAGALMSEMRRSRAGTFRGVLALLDIDGPSNRTQAGNDFHRAVAGGATRRAAELGFKTEVFCLNQEKMSLKRLDGILQSRAIPGIFLLPIKEDPDLTQFDWSRYAGVYTDYIIRRPSLHTICSNHYRSMLLVLDQLRARNYRRPGLVLRQLHDERLLYRWQASFLAYYQHSTVFEECRPLIVPELEKESFTDWFKTEQPDVVLCHDPAVLDWMKAAKAEVPRTHGFCCLNTSNASIPCAGLDLRPDLIGARGIELLIAQIHRNEYGPPEVPSTTTIVARWVEGPTVAPLKGLR
jgi:DNA-binding LacI/PurR family transcriptional regulator